MQTNVTDSKWIQDQFHFLDWTIFVLILMATFGIIIWADYKKNKKDDQGSALETLLLGRRLTLPLFVATLVSTWYGGIVGVTQLSYESGLYNFITQGVFWYITYLIFAFFMVSKVRKTMAVTLPDFIGKIVGPKSAKLSSVLNILNLIPIAYSISLAHLINFFFGIDYHLSLVLGVLFVSFYSIYGGFRAIVYSDLVQFFCMCLSVFMVLILSIHLYGGFDFLKSSLPVKHLSLTGGHSTLTLFAWGIIALSTLVDPNFYQRCFAAKSDNVAKKGILISTVIWALFDLCTTFGAMYAKAVMPQLDSGKAYFIYSISILPIGLKGFFLAGMFATILSTLDSYIFLAGTTFSHDLFKARYGGEKRRHIQGIVFMALITILLGFVFDGSVHKVWKIMGSYSAACLLVPVLFTLISHRPVKDMSFFLSSCMGIVFTTWSQLRPEHFLSIDGLYVGSAMTLCCLTLCHVLDSAPRS